MKRSTASSVQVQPTLPPAGEDWRATLNQAIRAHQQGNLDVAEGLYRQVLAGKLAQPDALHFLGVLCHQRGRSAEAVDLIGAALQGMPKHADAHNNLGNVHNECGRLAEAEACYRRALKFVPTHGDALGNLAMVLEIREQLPQAFAAYARFLQLAPANSRAHYLMGAFLRSHAEGIEHIEQAVGFFRRAFALDPTMLPALEAEGVSLYALKRHEEARQVYRDWLVRDPDNPVPRHMLAACGGTASPVRADDDYVRAEFDRFAGSFDRQLVENLNYRAPQVLAGALATQLPAPAAQWDVLDAGCGTGLCAPLLRAHARRLAGVDLSAGMLDRARVRGGYDELVEAELTGYLQHHPAEFDVVLSADTLVYFGELVPVLTAAYAALRPGGCLAFSLEALDGEGFVLSFSGRYQHSRQYVERALEAAGFTDARIAADSLRKEAGQPVASWVVLARRPAVRRQQAGDAAEHAGHHRPATAGPARDGQRLEALP